MPFCSGYKPDENVAFWVLHCKEGKDDKKPCSATKYRDSIDLLSLARFLHVIDVEPMVSELVLRVVYVGCVGLCWFCEMIGADALYVQSSMTSA